MKLVSSTNEKAIKLIKQNKLKPTIIIAENQYKGRGQYGKKWISIKGNLFMSLFFKIKKNKSTNSIVKKNILIIKNTLSKFVKEKINIKKPNDLIINRKKICGILHETFIKNGKKFLIVGIGIKIKKNPIIKGYLTGNLSEFSRKKINKNLIYRSIKINFEKELLSNNVSSR